VEYLLGFGIDLANRVVQSILVQLAVLKGVPDWHNDMPLGTETAACILHSALGSQGHLFQA
jgi:hypothetical protein